MRLIKLFSEHPRSVGMTYVGHMVRAIGFTILLIYAAVICLIHAIFPFLFEHDASNIVSLIHNEMRG